MAVSGTIGTTTFNTLRVIDNAFRRCRLPAQAITPEMQDYAKDALYLLLSELASVRTPSWCIEKLVYPFYENQPDVTLPLGTIDVLNANYRNVQPVTGATVSLPASYTVTFTSATAVNTVGVKWTAAAPALVFEVSDDTLTWTPVGTQSTTASAGQWTWTDISAAKAHTYFRITTTGALSFSEVVLGNTPQEIPLGLINRDTYVVQSNKAFPGRPVNFWYQRDRLQPVMHLWPAPNLAAEHAQLVVYRSRHIMDVGALQQDVDVPQRWLEAIIAALAAKVAAMTPSVDAALIPALEAKAGAALSIAWQGDGDGSPMLVQPYLSAYTR